MNNDFAIVVLSYNHPEITRQCLDSVKHQTVYVVHNGSTEKNRDLLQNQYPHMHHLAISENRGYSGGANFGLRHAFNSFEHVLFLTNDTELIQLPNHIPTGFNSVTIQKRNTLQIDSVAGELDLKKGRLKHLKSENELDTARLIYVPGTAYWIDRSTFENLKGFDESFHTYWEDVDFSYRASQLGFSKDTVIKHKIGKTCHKDDFYTYYLFQRNRKKFILKHGLSSFSFWLTFLFDIIKYCKFRFRYLWRILYE